MWLIPLIVIAVVVLIYWNPSPRLKKKWEKRKQKWDRRISKLRQERGMSEVWRDQKQYDPEKNNS